MSRLMKNTAPIKRLGPGKDKDDLSVIILAASAGKMDRFKYNRSLIRFPDNQSLIYKQIKTVYETFPKAEVIVVTGFQSKEVIQEIQQYVNRVRIVENERFKNTNAFRSAILGMRVCLNPNVLIMHGDLYFNKQSIADIAQDGSALVVDTKGQIGQDEVGLIVTDNNVTNLSYGLETKWAQMAFLTGKELAIMQKLSFDEENWMLCLHEGLNLIIEKDGVFVPLEASGQEIIEVDFPRDVKKLIGNK
jgi:choline kinase